MQLLMKFAWKNWGGEKVEEGTHFVGWRRRLRGAMRAQTWRQRLGSSLGDSLSVYVVRGSVCDAKTKTPFFLSQGKALLGSFLLKPLPVACPLYRIRGDRVWPICSQAQAQRLHINLASCYWLPRPFACVTSLAMSGGQRLSGTLCLLQVGG
jgi:hypothetical protein